MFISTLILGYNGKEMSPAFVPKSDWGMCANGRPAMGPCVTGMCPVNAQCQSNRCCVSNKYERIVMERLSANVNNQSAEEEEPAQLGFR